MQLQMLIQDPAFKKKFVLEKLLCHYLNTTRTDLRTNAQQELSPEIEQRIRADYRAYEEEYMITAITEAMYENHANDNILLDI